MNALFLNLLRTSLVIGVLSLCLILLSPLWNRKFAALWKKRLWCLLAAILLIGAFIRLPENAAKVVVTVPERQVVVTRPQRGTPWVQVRDPQAVPALEEVRPELGTADLTPEPVRHTVSLTVVAEIVWAAGAAGFGLWLAGGEFLFLRRVRRWEKAVRSGPLADTYQAVCTETGKRSVPRLLICPTVDSPMLTGLFRPKLLLPMENYTKAEAAYILRHELTHWQSHDLWWKLLLIAAGGIHWFNPAVWLLCREANRDIERACDERVMRDADAEDRRVYSGVLLSAVRKGRRPALSTSFYGGANVMKERLRNILSGTKRRGVALAVVCALAAVCTVPLVSCTQQTAAERNDAALKDKFQKQYSTENCSCIFADLTHDGLDELVAVELWQDSEKTEPLSARDTSTSSDGFQNGKVSVLHMGTGGRVTTIWSREFSPARAGNGELYLYRQDGEDYLLSYLPEESTATADYQYQLFSLSRNGDVQTKSQDKVQFDLPDKGDTKTAEATGFLHTVSTYLQRAKPLLCCDENESAGNSFAYLNEQYTDFDSESGDPADAPDAVQAMAEEYVKKQCGWWSNQQELDATGTPLTEKVQIVDSSLNCLQKVGQNEAPDGSGSSEIWKLDFQMQPKDPKGAESLMAGGSDLEAGWITASSDMGYPLLGVWKSTDGSYTEVETSFTGSVVETMQGSYSFYAAELVRQHFGLRPDSVQFTIYGDTGDTDAAYTLQGGSGWSLYLPENWKSLEPPALYKLEDSAEITAWQDPEKDGLAVYVLHDSKTAPGAEANRSALQDIWLTSAKHVGSLSFSEGTGNLDTSCGLVQVTDAVSSGTGGDSLWQAYTVGDGEGGSWAMVTRCPRAENETPDEDWVWDSAISFCADSVVQEKKLDAAVSSAILTFNKGNYRSGECQAEGHTVLDSTADGSVVTAYVLAMYGEYEFEDGNFVKAGGSGVIPVVITFEKNQDGAYTLKDYQESSDGSEYTPSIKKLFPEKLQPQCLQISDETAEQLRTQEQTQAEEYLISIGRTHDGVSVGDYGDFPHPLLTDRGVSVAVSNALVGDKRLADYPSWVGNREQIEDGVRYVYQVDYQETTHRILYSKRNDATGKTVEQRIFDSVTGRELSEK